MKLKLKRILQIPAVIILLTITITSCEKGILVVNEVKEFYQVDHVPVHRFDGGWYLKLEPNGIADLAPGGDVMLKGTYKVKGAKITVKDDQNIKLYIFEVVANNEI